MQEKSGSTIGTIGFVSAVLSLGLLAVYLFLGSELGDLWIEHRAKSLAVISALAALGLLLGLVRGGSTTIMVAAIVLVGAVGFFFYAGVSGSSGALPAESEQG